MPIFTLADDRGIKLRPRIEEAACQIKLPVKPMELVRRPGWRVTSSDVNLRTEDDHIRAYATVVCSPGFDLCSHSGNPSATSPCCVDSGARATLVNDDCAGGLASIREFSELKHASTRARRGKV